MIKKSVFLEAEGLKIAGQFYCPNDRVPSYPTVCICHGIPSGNPPDPNDGGYPLLAERICRQGLAALIFNFRGTGGSGGNFDILGWGRDLEAAIDYLYSLPEVDKAHLSLLGFSGGAAVSVYVASQDNRVSSVAACACPAEFTLFTKFDEPAYLINHFRIIGVFRDKDSPESVEEWLDGFRVVSPIQHVAEIAPRPLLLVHGSKDETVALDHGKRLYNKAREPKQLIIVDGAGHQLRQNDQAMAMVMNWLKAQIG